MDFHNAHLPQGFIGLHANVGLKDSGDDDCLLVASSVPTESAAVFTQSRFAGPSVLISKKSMASNQPFQGLVVLSKNANVATGRDGVQHAQELQRLAAGVMKLPPEQVLVASTGVIGRKYPMVDIRNSFARFPEQLSQVESEKAARAMMTTDTRPKVSTGRCGDSIIVGIAKGVGMIEPNMATLLVFFFTDAAVERSQLKEIFSRVVDRTFNAMSIDTDQSTSDTAAIFANGLAGQVEPDKFEACLYDCALDLVKQIVRDGEGGTKTIIVNVTDARDIKQARLVAKSVVNSPLVKTAVHGSDPNWGRVVMAIGKLDTELDITPETTKVAFGAQEVYPPRAASMQSDDLAQLKRYLQQDEVEINISLGIGNGQFTAYGCDLSEGYIRINADYTT
jgi:glutamate N-acetyltransferase/amino-acid N-acetyltransferase